jgi:hypothetical protein
MNFREDRTTNHQRRFRTIVVGLPIAIALMPLFGQPGGNPAQVCEVRAAKVNQMLLSSKSSAEAAVIAAHQARWAYERSAEADRWVDGAGRLRVDHNPATAERFRDYQNARMSLGIASAVQRRAALDFALSGLPSNASTAADCLDLHARQFDDTFAKNESNLIKERAVSLRVAALASGNRNRARAESTLQSLLGHPLQNFGFDDRMLQLTASYLDTLQRHFGAQPRYTHARAYAEFLAKGPTDTVFTQLSALASERGASLWYIYAKSLVRYAQIVEALRTRQDFPEIHLNTTLEDLLQVKRSSNRSPSGTPYPELLRASAHALAVAVSLVHLEKQPLATITGTCNFALDAANIALKWSDSVRRIHEPDQAAIDAFLKSRRDGPSWDSVSTLLANLGVCRVPSLTNPDKYQQFQAEYRRLFGADPAPLLNTVGTNAPPIQREFRSEGRHKLLARYTECSTRIEPVTPLNLGYSCVFKSIHSITGMTKAVTDSSLSAEVISENPPRQSGSRSTPSGQTNSGVGQAPIPPQQPVALTYPASFIGTWNGIAKDPSSGEFAVTIEFVDRRPNVMGLVRYPSCQGYIFHAQGVTGKVNFSETIQSRRTRCSPSADVTLELESAKKMKVTRVGSDGQRYEATLYRQ